MAKLERLQRLSRLRLLGVSSFAAAALAGIAYLLSRGLTRPEVLVVDATLLGLVLASYATAFDEFRSLLRSQTSLLEEGAAPAGETWHEVACAHVAELAARGKARQPSGAELWTLERLPTGAEVIETLRGESERALVLLRWFAGGAVLVGLLGTLFGLIDAIQAAVAVLKTTAESDAAGVSSQQLSRALEPLGSAFVCSGAGVLASLTLLLVRQAYEAELEAHFSGLERWLEASMGRFFAGWAPPTTRLEQVVLELRAQNAALVGETRALLDAATSKVVEGLQPIGAALVETTRTGLAEAAGRQAEVSREAFGRIADDAASTLERSARTTQELARTEQEQRLGQWDAMTRAQREWFTASVTEFRKEIDALQDRADGEFRRARGEFAQQVDRLKELGALLDATSTELTGVNQRLDVNGRLFTERAQGLADAAADRLERLAREVATRTATSLDAAQEAFERAVGGSREELAAAARSLEAGTKALASAARAQHEALASAIGATHDEARRTLATWSEQHARVLEQTATELNARASQAQEALLDQLYARLSESRSTIEALERLTGRINASTEAVSQAAERFGETATAAAKAAGDAARQAREAASDAETIQEARSGIAQELRQLRAGLEEIARHVRDAAGVMEDQALSLKGLTSVLETKARAAARGDAA